MAFDLGTLDSGEQSLPFGLLVSVNILKFEGYDFSFNGCVQKMQAQWQTMQTLIRLFL